MTRTLLLSVLTTVAVAGCASDGPTPEEQRLAEAAKQEAIEDILTKPLDVEEYARTERCLSTRVYDHVDVIDDQHVIFRGNGDELWLNKLRQRCVGLRPRDILRFEMRDSRVCDLDGFEAVDNFRYAAKSGRCTLGKFTPVTPEQVNAIEMAVKEARES